MPALPVCSPLARELFYNVNDRLEWVLESMPPLRFSCFIDLPDQIVHLLELRRMSAAQCSFEFVNQRRQVLAILFEKDHHPAGLALDPGVQEALTLVAESILRLHLFDKLLKFSVACERSTLRPGPSG